MERLNSRCSNIDELHLDMIRVEMSTHASGQSNFVISLIAIGLAFFGLTLLALSFAYARDLTAISNVPFEVWSVLCGRPTDNPMTLPILVCVSVFSILIGGAMLALNRIRARGHS